MNVEIDLQRWNEIEDAWRRAPEMVARELAGAIAAAEAHLRGEVQVLTPVATGLLRQSIIAGEPEVLADNVIGMVGTSLNYAVPVELGVRSHKREIKTLAHGVSTFTHPGMKGYFMFHQALESNQAQLQGFFEAARNRIAANLAGGAA